MVALLETQAMRAAERAAIDSGAVTGAALMERAGGAVVAAIRARWPDLWRGRARALVLCGPGNNGGDGYVIARRLRDAGWKVAVLATGAPARQPPDAARMRALWEGAGGRTGPLDPAAVAAALPADLVIDAVFGAGLARPPEGAVAAALALLAAGGAGGARVVAVDGPSGLDLDTGAVADAGGVPAAHLTVTFHRARPGHYLGAGPGLCGDLAVADIGLAAPDTGLAAPGPGAIRLVRPDLPPEGPEDPQVQELARAQGHKFTHGHVLVLSGPAIASGAARLAGRAALRVGAGLVTLGARPEDLAPLAPAVTAVMLRPVAGGAALGAWLAGDRRIGTLCLGPGLGLDGRAAELVAAALAAGRATVLDADAITLVARDPALRAALHPGCVLTPHEGEFARLMPEAAPGDGPLAATRRAARALGATVLRKGPSTVIAAPDGTSFIHAATGARAVPWLATAGAGDVLAGLIAGLLARGLAPARAAALGAWLHVEAARAFGPGLIAEDLPDLVPVVLGAVLKERGSAPLRPDGRIHPGIFGDR